jgi:hypothetical protein
MKQLLLAALTGAAILTATSSIAGEIGVTNRYTRGESYGSGKAWSNTESHFQRTEHSASGAKKIETSTYGGGQQDSSVSTPGQNDGFQSNTTAGSWSMGKSSFTESGRTTSGSKESFGSNRTTFEHSVGSFAY